MSSKVQSECGSVSKVSGLGSSLRIISGGTPTTTTTGTTSAVTGGVGVVKGVDPRVLMVLGGLVAMEV